MAPDRVRIEKHGLEWQVLHQGKIRYVCGTQQGAMDYVAAQLKIREAMKAAVLRLVSNYKKGTP